MSVNNEGNLLKLSVNICKRFWNTYLAECKSERDRTNRMKPPTGLGNFILALKSNQGGYYKSGLEMLS